MSDSERVTIFDTTLRDGEQSPGCSMSTGEKVRLAHQLDRLGVDAIEAGFPISSEGDFNAVQAVAREIQRPIIAALARCRREDIEKAWGAIQFASRPRIHIFLATSDIHLQHKLKMSRRDCLEQARDGVRLAKSLCNDVQFSPEDATRTDSEFLYSVLEAVIEVGAGTINIPDTVGYTVPGEFSELITNIRHRVGGIERVVISAHCHDDLGLAAANSLAAVGAGARQVECTMNGIGERAGNTSLEEFVMTLRVRSDRYSYETSVVSEQLFPASQLLSEITGVVVQPNKAIVGRNAFAHEAGIHQDGVIKNSLTYEIMTPQSVGVPATRIVLGKHSGRHALSLRCEELGFRLGSVVLDQIYREFLAIVDEKKVIDDQRLREVVARECARYNGTSRVDDSWLNSNEPLVETSPIGDSKSSLAGSAWNDLSTSSSHQDGEQQEDYLWGV